MAIGRKRIAEAARAFATQCEDGIAPDLGTNFHDGCTMQRVAELLDGAHGVDVALEVIKYDLGRHVSLVYYANDEASPSVRAAAVVAPLRALADALDAVQP